MPDYTDAIMRAVSGSDPLVPEPMAQEVIQELPKQSAALSLMNRTLLSSKTERMPVLDVLPVAYFVGGDTGMKQTTMEAWKNITLVVEELAAIVPIPESYLADSSIDIWGQVRPRMVEALGAVIDAATFWGVGKPSTWGTDIYTASRAAGNLVQDGYLDDGTTAADDFGQTVTALGDLMSQTGYSINGFAGRPGLNWKLMGLRASGSGVPIFNPNASLADGSNGAALYGYPIPMVDNGSWDATKAQLLAGDFTKSIIGLRQDMTWKLADEAVISNDAGQVILNLFQQDAVALRVVMRLAYATVNPVTIMQRNKPITQRFPFGVVTTHGVT
jgi:HK97 family phage major capsid protein